MEGARGSASADRTLARDLREVPPEAIFEFRLWSGARGGDHDAAYSVLESIFEEWESAFVVEFLDSEGAVLAAVKTWQDLVMSGVDYDDHVPSVNGLWPRAVDFASWRLVRGTEVISERLVGGGPLHVEILEPAPGAVAGGSDPHLEVVWRVCGDTWASAAQPDVTAVIRNDLSILGEEMIVSVGHSADGGATYEPMLTKLSGPGSKAAAAYESRDGLHKIRGLWPMWPALLEGSDEARIRVLVSSGARWAAAESAAFKVEAPTDAAMPEIEVLEPRDGATVEHGAVIELKARISGLGALSDPQMNGDLDRHGSVAVTWSSVLLGGGDGQPYELAPVPRQQGAGPDGVYIWRLDTAQLKAGPNRFLASGTVGGLSARDFVELTVVAPAGAPTAVDDDARWQPNLLAVVSGLSQLRPSGDDPLVIEVLQNDLATGAGLDPATLRIVDQPRTGTANTQGATVVYTAPQDDGRAVRRDAFTYRICSPQPQPACSQATVTVHLVGTTPEALALVAALQQARDAARDSDP